MQAYRNAALFVVLSVLWGTAFMVIKAGLEFIPPVLFAALRYDIAGVIMLVYAVMVTDYWRPRSRADWVTVGVGAVLIIALYNAFLFVGEQGVTSGVAAILVAMNPILATGFSRVFLADERLSVVGLVGLLLGFIGVALVVNVDPGNLLTSELVWPGLVLLAAASIAFGSVLVQRIGAGISTEGMVAWSCAIGAVLLHVISMGVLRESFSDVEVSVGAVFAVVYLAVFASAVGYFIYFDLLDRLGSIEINLVSYANPVPAGIAGWLALNEGLTLNSVVGFVLIFAGFGLMKRHALLAEFKSLGEFIPRLR